MAPRFPAGIFRDALGLLGLTALPVLIALYLLKPDPRTYRLPTLAFLVAYVRVNSGDDFFESFADAWIG